MNDWNAHHGSQPTAWLSRVSGGGDLLGGAWVLGGRDKVANRFEGGLGSRGWGVIIGQAGLRFSSRTLGLRRSRAR